MAWSFLCQLLAVRLKVGRQRLVEAVAQTPPLGARQRAQRGIAAGIHPVDARHTPAAAPLLASRCRAPVSRHGQQLARYSQQLPHGLNLGRRKHSFRHRWLRAIVARSLSPAPAGGLASWPVWASISQSAATRPRTIPIVTQSVTSSYHGCRASIAAAPFLGDSNQYVSQMYSLRPRRQDSGAYSNMSHGNGVQVGARPGAAPPDDPRLTVLHRMRALQGQKTPTAGRRDPSPRSPTRPTCGGWSERHNNGCSWAPFLVHGQRCAFRALVPGGPPTEGRTPGAGRVPHPASQPSVA